MKIVSVNSVNFGSTGKIMLQIADTARKAGHEALVAYPSSGSNKRNSSPDDITIGSAISRNIHLVLGRYTGRAGTFSRIATLGFLRRLSALHPDVIHLHNLHNSYINLPMLFKYIKKHNISVVWTLHDCWAFTGHCPHFTLAGCDKWRSGCHSCPSYREYPQSRVDNSKFTYALKKKCFTGVENLTVVTPSEWLAGLVRESFLGEYPIKVINNGIDLSVFKPIESDFKKRHNIPDSKSVLLGVSFGWGEKKGLDVFVELASRLDPEKYQIVLVGTDDGVDACLPDNIISIHRTQNQTELAEIYSAADLFINPTREENYPTVNMEAIACGTPVLTFRTGGSPEIPDAATGSVVDCGDVDALEREIGRICAERPYSESACLERAGKFDMNQRFEEYVKLYESLK